MISLDLSRVPENAMLISVLMTCASAWLDSALLRRMDAHWHLARHYRIANMLMFHKPSDLDTVGDSGSVMRALATSLLANAEARVVYRQESDQLGSTATALGLTGTGQSLLPTLGTQPGLVTDQAPLFVVQHQLHPAELVETSARASGAR